jgi:uncharacterized membrane protein
VVEFQHSVVVNKPVNEVFAYMADFRNNPKWSPDIAEVTKVSLQPPGKGTTWRQVVVARNRRMPYDLTVDQFEGNRMYHFKGTGGAIDYEVTCRFEPAQAGTKVSIAVSGQVKGFAKLFRGAVERSFREAIMSSADNLRKVLETSR